MTAKTRLFLLLSHLNPEPCVVGSVYVVEGSLSFTLENVVSVGSSLVEVVLVVVVVVLTQAHEAVVEI